jgi:hypothetical protein
MWNEGLWPRRMNRRSFLRRYGIASSALTFSPFFLERMAALCQAASNLVPVYKVQNGTYAQNITKLWQLLGGPQAFFSPTDVVVIKANSQWPNQGYTHTGCIKAVIDQILQLPGFSGEVLICDNLQAGNGMGSGTYGFDAVPAYRNNNWQDNNWNGLAANYQASGKPVATVQWQTDATWRPPTLPLPSWSTWNPANGKGWSRYFFNWNGRNTYLSYPVFSSPLTPGRMIDLRAGVWESGSYTGRKVKTIVMPTLNNHDYSGGKEDAAGITSAIKSFFGATEIYHDSAQGDDTVWNGYYSIHSASITQYAALIAGQLVGIFLNNLYAPVLYITPAIYSGWYNRFAPGGAAATATVLACTNPVSLDYIACRDVISKVGSPPPTWLDPSTQNNNTWRQIQGCNSQGIGTALPSQISVIAYDFNHPTTTRRDIEQEIQAFKTGQATDQDVRSTIERYMSGN